MRKTKRMVESVKGNCKLNIKSSNGGFSLIEIIIAVMILSLFIGSAGLGLSLISGKAADQCANRLSSSLSHARTSTMGKYRNTITIENTSSGLKFSENIVITIDDSGVPDRTQDRSGMVGDKNVSVKYSNDSGGSFNDFSKIRMRFDSGSGKLKSVDLGSGNLENVSETSYMIFEVSKANTTRYVIVSALTGKVQVATDLSVLTI